LKHSCRAVGYRRRLRPQFPRPLLIDRRDLIGSAFMFVCGPIFAGNRAKLGDFGGSPVQNRVAAQVSAPENGGWLRRGGVRQRKPWKKGTDPEPSGVLGGFGILSGSEPVPFFHSLFHLTTCRDKWLLPSQKGFSLPACIVGSRGTRTIRI